MTEANKTFLSALLRAILLDYDMKKFTVADDSILTKFGDVFLPTADDLSLCAAQPQ